MEPVGPLAAAEPAASADTGATRNASAAGAARTEHQIATPIANTTNDVPDAITENSGGVTFTVTNWSSARASLMVNGFTNQPRVLLDGQEIQLVAPHQYQPSSGRLVLRLQGTVRVQIVSPAAPRLEIKTSSTNASVDVSWPAPASDFVHPLRPRSP